MPIRFRCAYCNQLMGIARRKGGSVVICPNCQGQVVVPTPDSEESEGPTANLFDRPDFGAGVLDPNSSNRPIVEAPPSEEIDVQPVALPSAFVAANPRRGRQKLVLLILTAFLLLAIAFGAGFALARLM